MDLEEFRTFLAAYEGEDSDEAHSVYRTLIAAADGDFQVADQVDPRDAARVKTHIVEMLDIAERVGYRFQALARDRIEEGAILVEDVDHYENVLRPPGFAAYRRDWMDREDECVAAFLFDRYPMLDPALRIHFPNA